MRLHKKIFCFILAAILVAAVFVFPAAAAEPYVPVNDVVTAAADIIYRNEGGYSTVVKDDNGAVSIGKVQWHGSRALELLKDIIARNTGNAWNILGQALYDEIVSSTNWGTRIVTADEASRISTLINTPEGRASQDFFAHIDIKSYILHGKYMGISDPQALIYFADVENQYGFTGVTYPAKRACELAGGSYANVTLALLHQAALEIYPKYASRRERTYNAASAVTFTYTQDTPEYEIWRLNGGVNMRTGPGTDYLILTQYPGGTEINVYSKLDRGGYTWGETDLGWLVLNFCTYVRTVPASTAQPDPLKGDANADGQITLADVLLIARYTLYGYADGIDEYLADMDGNGSITMSDVIAVATWVLQNT